MLKVNGNFQEVTYEEREASAETQKRGKLHAISEGSSWPMCGPHKFITFTTDVAFYWKLLFKSLIH